MVRYAVSIVAMAGLACTLPLNINLGAYSPALVVGDGEISFGGNQDVSNLMNVLEGAAVNTAASVANSNAAAAAGTATTSGEAATAGTANNAATTDKVVSAAADPALQQQAQQIAALQGLGKEIAPRAELAAADDDADADADDADADDDDAAARAKRDLAGFDRALTFAEAALTKGPKIELGTGKEGSGVGILVDNSPAARTAAAKRDVAPGAASAPKRTRAKVTTMYVRSGVPASLQSKRDVDGAPAAAAAAARAVFSAPRSLPGVAVPPAAAPAASRRDAIDAVNLNVDGDQGLTMTFVETVEDGEDED